MALVSQSDAELPLCFGSQGKAAQMLFLSLIIGLSFLKLSNGQAGVQDRQGSLFFLTVQVR